MFFGLKGISLTTLVPSKNRLVSISDFFAQFPTFLSIFDFFISEHPYWFVTSSIIAIVISASLYNSSIGIRSLVV
jgi:hypothetical protein